MGTAGRRARPAADKTLLPCRPRWHRWPSETGGRSWANTDELPAEAYLECNRMLLAVFPPSKSGGFTSKQFGERAGDHDVVTDILSRHNKQSENPTQLMDVRWGTRFRMGSKCLNAKCDPSLLMRSPKNCASLNPNRVLGGPSVI